MSEYQDREGFELDQWPEMRTMVNDLVNLVHSERNVSQQLKRELFTMASVASGCTHCQSHGAFSLNAMGVDTERIQAIWEYETSELFSDAERAALNLVRAAAQSPNATTPEHFVELRKHWTDEQIVEILTVNCLAGWLNRWNDTVATVTDQESIDWATENLSQVGWKAGKHVGEAHEQRAGHPSSVGWTNR
ncbi:MAG: carboxymuconolactone decarboxylase family protein [Acidimicrobiales bacterium]|nr:carboxymuconolactone decarboxylase family protein [Acidimicrobiales bacterium]RZV48128.1 MAG: carboxymuconolactone decarboxylase family protein [Acidimicrobiales bacterium]